MADLQLRQQACHWSHVWTTAQPRCLLLPGEHLQDRLHNCAHSSADLTAAAAPWPLSFFLPALIERGPARGFFCLPAHARQEYPALPLVRLRCHKPMVGAAPSHHQWPRLPSESFPIRFVLLIGAGSCGGLPSASGPGLQPGPRRQARWGGRGLRGQRRAVGGSTVEPGGAAPYHARHSGFELSARDDPFGLSTEPQVSAATQGGGCTPQWFVTAWSAPDP